MNAFMLFSADYRKVIQKENPTDGNREISARLGSLWSTIDPTLKDTYFTRAKHIELAHRRKYPDYTFLPSKKARGSSTTTPTNSNVTPTTVQTSSSQYQRFSHLSTAPVPRIASGQSLLAGGDSTYTLSRPAPPDYLTNIDYSDVRILSNTKHSSSDSGASSIYHLVPSSAQSAAPAGDQVTTVTMTCAGDGGDEVLSQDEVIEVVLEAGDTTDQVLMDESAAGNQVLFKPANGRDVNAPTQTKAADEYIIVESTTSTVIDENREKKTQTVNYPQPVNNTEIVTSHLPPHSTCKPYTSTRSTSLSKNLSPVLVPVPADNPTHYRCRLKTPPDCPQGGMIDPTILSTSIHTTNDPNGRTDYVRTMDSLDTVASLIQDMVPVQQMQAFLEPYQYMPPYSCYPIPSAPFGDTGFYPEAHPAPFMTSSYPASFCPDTLNQPHLTQQHDNSCATRGMPLQPNVLHSPGYGSPSVSLSRSLFPPRSPAIAAAAAAAIRSPSISAMYAFSGLSPDGDLGISDFDLPSHAYL